VFTAYSYLTLDNLGRVTTSERYWDDDGNPATGGDDEDVTVATTYTVGGQVATYTAHNPDTGNQTTTYVYGSSVGGVTPEIYRSDLLRAVIYPDSDDTTALGDGTDGVYDRVEYRYNRQGQVTQMKDPGGTVHEYAFDGLGRQTADKATTLGTNIDGSVRRIERSYEVRGMVASITSYDATTGGNAVNQVLREYNDFGLLEKEYQEHDGLKDANSLYVGYNYAGAADGLRLESVRYPNGRLVHYTYGTAGSDADNLSRLDAIKADNSGTPGTTLASYTYLGLGTVVREDYEEPDVRLDLWGGTSGTFQGFDRFGRVVDHLWRDYGASSDADRFKYGYDRAGNRLWKENDVAANLGTPVHLDELYDYDDVYRLINTERGNLSGTHDAITDKAFEQDWALDATGNWSDFDVDDDGDDSWELEQTRSHNVANETGTIGATSGTNWADPSHDAAGNMTSMPKPSDLGNSITGKYDAWNRLVEVSDGGVLIAKFRYDGEGRRILKMFDTDTPRPDGLDTYEHLFLSGQQVIETREGTLAQPTATPAQAETLQPKYQQVWSPRYIDSLILRDENTDTDNLCDDSRVYYLADANFNVTALVDTTGNVVERYLYSPYGEVTVLDPDFTADADGQSDYANTTLYTGRTLDTPTGLMYYRARYYHAQLGRFVARDPIGYEEGPHLYAYALLAPLSLVDAFGLSAASPPDTGEMQYTCHYATYMRDNLVGEPPKSEKDLHDRVLGSSPLSNAEHDKCMEKVWSVKRSEEFRDYLSYFPNKRCKNPEIQCLCCENPLAKGVLYPRIPMYGGAITPVIALCYNNMENLAQILRHEFTHAIQMCGGRTYPDANSCEVSLRKELEAFYCAHQCDSYASCLESALKSSCFGGACNVTEITAQFIQDQNHWFDSMKSVFCKFE